MCSHNVGSYCVNFTIEYIYARNKEYHNAFCGINRAYFGKYLKT
jgi:hypothetical protein